MREIEVQIPSGITAVLKDRELSIKGPKGENKKLFEYRGISLEQKEGKIFVKTLDETKKTNAVIWTVKKHIENMMRGVQKEFEYKMAVVFLLKPMNLSVKGEFVEISNYSGEKRPRKAKIVKGCKIEVKGKDVFIRGIDKEAVGQTAANIEKATKTRHKDSRIFQDGVYIVSKGV